MKKLLLSISLTLIVATSFGQAGCGFGAAQNWYFDGGFTPWGTYLQIDSLSNPNNIWQIGVPQKTIINSAYSPPNVMITDLINHYPPNDTSAFIFKHIDQGGWSAPHTAELAGYYKVNSDSLNDYGTIEISLDHGTTWVNLITDTIYSSYYQWYTPKPVLTGNSNGWQNFYVSLAQLGMVFPVNSGDTILYKFTFISDSIADTLDGLAYDNFEFCNIVESIEEIPNDNLIVVYPNPTSDLLFINRRTQHEKESVKLFNYTGQLLFEDNDFKTKTIDTQKLNLTNGFYFLRYSDTKYYAMKKFIVQH